jgi:hypothetical protein
MKASPAAPASLAALLPALLAAGCASSPWQSKETVPGGTFYVPKLYAPLLPGSIYPDRKVSVPAQGRPAMILVCPTKGDCRTDTILERAAQRGMVVLVLKRGSEAPLKNDLLQTRAEADATRIGWLLVEPTGDFLGRWMGAGAPGEAAAIVGPPPHGDTGFPSSPSKKILLAASPSDAPLEAPDGTVLKLYSPNQKGLLPPEAFRDAVEWLAGELGAR